MDITTLALAKKYANGIASGISSYAVDGLTLKITTTSGQVLTMQFPSPKVEDIDITADGHIIFTLEDGTKITSGEAIPGAKISAEAGNALYQKSDGLFVPVGSVDISEDEGNAIESRTDGLYVATVSGGASSADEVSYDNSVSGIEADNIQDVLDSITGGYEDIPVYNIATISTSSQRAVIGVQRNDGNIVQIAHTEEEKNFYNEILVKYGSGEWQIYSLTDSITFNNNQYAKNQKITSWSFSQSVDYTMTAPGSFVPAMFSSDASNLPYDVTGTTYPTEIETVEDAFVTLNTLKLTGNYYKISYQGYTDNAAYIKKYNSQDVLVKEEIKPVGNSYYGEMIITVDDLILKKPYTSGQVFLTTSSNLSTSLTYNDTTYSTPDTNIIEKDWGEFFLITVNEVAHTNSGAEFISYANQDSGLSATTVKGAIDELKSDMPNIVDNLTSTSSTDALSAKQGKVLKDYIDEQIGGALSDSY